MNPNSYAYIGFGIAAAFFLAFGLFYVVNELGLEEFTTKATVLEKHYTPPGTTYSTTVVNNQTIVQPRGTDEIYAVAFDVGGQQQLGMLTKEQYEQVDVGDQLTITARTKRITRDMQIINVVK